MGRVIPQGGIRAWVPLLAALALAAIWAVRASGCRQDAASPPVPGSGVPSADLTSRPRNPENRVPAPLPGEQARSTTGPRDLRALFELSERIVDAYFKGTPDRIPPDIAHPEDFASGLPVGYFTLLVRAYPGEAFAYFSEIYTNTPDRRATAMRALQELARAGHPAAGGFFNSLLLSGEPERVREALRALVHLEVPQLCPRLLPLLDEAIRSPGNGVMVGALLNTISSLEDSDPSLVLSRFATLEAMEKEARLPGMYGTEMARKRLALLRADDPTASFSKALVENPVPPNSSDSAARALRLDHLDLLEWASDRAVRRNLRELVPALQQALRLQVEDLRSQNREKELDVLGAKRGGVHDLPGGEGANFLAEVRVIAGLRRAIHALGGELSPEDRQWLDGMRLLRDPKEYLREGGVRVTPD